MAFPWHHGMRRPLLLVLHASDPVITQGGAAGMGARRRRSPARPARRVESLEVDLDRAAARGLSDRVEEAVRRSREARLTGRGRRAGVDDRVSAMERRSRRVG